MQDDLLAVVGQGGLDGCGEVRTGQVGELAVGPRGHEHAQARLVGPAHDAELLHVEPAPAVGVVGHLAEHDALDLGDRLFGRKGVGQGRQRHT